VKKNIYNGKVDYSYVICMKFLFWFSFIWIIYAYVGYFLLIFIFNLFKRNKHELDESYFPRVTHIVAAYNEEKVIEEKIKQTLSLNYPKSQIEVIIASDASTDNTDSIVKGFNDDRIVLVRQEKRGGKTSAQNLAVKKAKGEILVFSDATTTLETSALRRLIRHFKDESVGCVGGEERFIKSDNEISTEAGFFWKYEKLLRRQESKFNTMIGVSGCVFAIRKKLYEPLDDVLIEDFILPLKLASQGLKTVCEKKAIAYERATKDTKEEFSRKARIVAGGIGVIVNMRHLLNPFKYPLLAFQIISHKIFRWCVPVFMVVLFISNLFLIDISRLFFIVLVLQISFYSLASIGYMFKESDHMPKGIKIIYHFCIMNFSAVIGVIKFLKGEKKAIWQPIR